MKYPKSVSFKGLNGRGSNCLTPPELGHAIINYLLMEAAVEFCFYASDC